MDKTKVEASHSFASNPVLPFWALGREGLCVPSLCSVRGVVVQYLHFLSLLFFLLVCFHLLCHEISFYGTHALPQHFHWKIPWITQKGRWNVLKFAVCLVSHFGLFVLPLGSSTLMVTPPETVGAAQVLLTQPCTQALLHPLGAHTLTRAAHNQ